MTALLHACEKGHVEVVEILLGAGADVNSPARHRRGKTALDLPKEAGHEKIVEMLLDKGSQTEN